MICSVGKKGKRKKSRTNISCLSTTNLLNMNTNKQTATKYEILSKVSLKSQNHRFNIRETLLILMLLDL